MMTRLALHLVILVLLIGCEEDSVGVGSAYLNQEFSLKVGQQASVRGMKLTITFRAVTEDSRCPEGAMCFWAGNGRIVVELRKDGSPATSAELNIYLEPKRVSYSSYQIQLVSLEPHPRIDSKISPMDYVATLIVTKYLTKQEAQS